MSCGVAPGEKWESCCLEVVQGVHGFHPQEGLFGTALKQQNEQSESCLWWVSAEELDTAREGEAHQPVPCVTGSSK